jgi:hypothetical protein
MLCVASLAAAQVRTVGQIAGVVHDPTGAIIVGAKLTAVEEGTGLTREAISGTDGRFLLVDLPYGSYRLTAVTQGFKTAVFPGIKVEVGRTTDVTVTLELGPVEATVVVEAGAEMLQTTATTIEATVTGRTLRSLPLNNRDVLDFVMLMPGAQQGGSARQSTFMGLPKGAVNISMDGLNIQDNLLKSAFGGGMFTLIRPKLDNVEEITVTTAGQGADASGEGAIQIRFATRRGANEWHGGGFWYFRSQWLNANTWFNNAQRLPRPRNHLNQYGGNLGGPIVRDRLFFFFNIEDFRLPEARTRQNLILTTEAQGGVFRYRDTGGVVRTADLFAIAGAGDCDLVTAGAQPCPSTVDPVVAGMFSTINGTRANGVVTSEDLFRERLRWDASAKQRRWFPTLRLDYHITDRIRWHGVANYNNFDSTPDTLNNMDPSYPGLPLHAGQLSKRHSWTTALNWNISTRLNYEFRLGRQSSLVSFFSESTISDLFPQGYRLFWPLSLNSLHTRPSEPGVYWGGTSRSLPSRRDTPALQWGNNLTLALNKHTLSFGTTLSVLTYWDESFLTAGTPLIGFGVIAGDPVGTVFTTTTLPGISSEDLTNARLLYAMLVGRISAITGSTNVDETNKAYAAGRPLTRRDRQNEFGVYVTDSWRVHSTLTVNAGLRWQYQGAPYNRNDIYTSPTYEELWGKSGPGNLFKPGTLAGPADPQIRRRSKGLYDRYLNAWAPSLGMAWQPNFDHRLWNFLFGGPAKSVFRGGYSIAYTREGLAHHTTFAGGSPGLTQSMFLSPGDPGFPTTSLTLLRNPLPTLRTNPPAFGSSFSQSLFTFGGVSLNGIDSNLKPAYVQSWHFGVQRELTPNNVIEIRYVGNHGVRLWRGLNLNEVNIFENNFLTNFRNAQNNLSICRANLAACGGTARFDNRGLSGQVPLPIFEAAFGTLGPLAALPSGSGFASGTFITQLDQGQAGAMANSLASSATFLCRLVGSALGACSVRFPGIPAGAFPSNLFQVNPDFAGQPVWMLTNSSHSTYNSMQVEFRRRMASGLMLTTNYTFSKSLTDLFADSAASQLAYTTLRNKQLDKGPSPWDLRHTFRAHWIYELPFGPGRKWNVDNPVVNRMIEGWEFLGVLAIQSGRVFKLTSGRATVNQFDSGVTFPTNMTWQQLQSLAHVTKVPGRTSTVYFINPALIAADGRSNTALLAPPTTPGQFGNFVYLYGPRFVKPDLTIAKKTRITEKVRTEFRAEFFNAFNYQNFLVGGSGSAGVTHSITSTSFGQTGVIFNDLGNQDQGPRMVQFVFRVSF